jgi:hypothetical protein
VHQGGKRSTALEAEDTRLYLLVIPYQRVFLYAAVSGTHEPLAPLWVARLCRAKYCNCNCVMLQAEPRAQLSLASRSASQNLKISPQDLILYSAKVRPSQLPNAF